MTDCGCLGNARELRREVAASFDGVRDHARLAARLIGFRHFTKLTEPQAQAWFGVRLATLERIEQHEIEPDDELAGRIWHGIDTFLPNSAAEARPPAVSRAAPMAREGRGAPTGKAGSLPVPPLCAAPTFALREVDAGPPFIEMSLAGDTFELPLAAATTAAAELVSLLAMARGLA